LKKKNKGELNNLKKREKRGEDIIENLNNKTNAK
jgi:hypothetical protein